MTQINISDLIDIRHGEALLEVTSKRVKTKGVTGHRGLVKVKFPKTPQANYTVPVEGNALRICDVDAVADAIALRKDIIAQNKVQTVEQRQAAINAERAESPAALRALRRAEDGHRE